MRVVGRDEFLKLPTGVVYSKWGGLNTLCVKGHVMNTELPPAQQDWTYLILGWSPAGGTWPARKGEPVEFNEDYGRDGSFNQDDVFHVFDAADLHKFIAVLQDAIFVTA